MFDLKTKTTIAVGAAVSGLLNYAGLSREVAAENTWLLMLCAFAGLVVALSISLFWSYAFGIMPHLRWGTLRRTGWAVIGAGVGLILMVSTYWNLVAISGHAIVRELGKSVVSAAETRLAAATQIGAAYRGYQADLAAFEANTAAIRQREIDGTGLSPLAGEGSVSDTMGQVVDAIASLRHAVDAAAHTIAEHISAGEVCLADLRAAVDAGDAAGAGAGLACLNQAVALMTEQDARGSIGRTLRGLAASVTIPAGIDTEAQRTIVATFLDTQQDQATRLAEAIAAAPPVTFVPLTMDQPTLIEGILIHWRAIVPAIAAALAIDLLPLIILIMQVLHGDNQVLQGRPRSVLTLDALEDALQHLARLQPLAPLPSLDLPPPYIDTGAENAPNQTDDRDDKTGV